MKRVISAISIFVLSFALAGFALAQEDNGGNIGRIYLVDVKDGHGADFEAGVKAWIECYGQNGGKNPWGVYSAETGKLGRYAFVTGGHEWSVFDEAENADEACAEVLNEKFFPHIGKTVSHFTARMDELGRYTEGDYGVVHVINFKVGNGHRFVAAISRITEAAREAGWGNFAWYNVIAGGHHASDFFVVVPRQKFAAFESDEPGLWEMVESVHGKEGAGQIRAELDATVEHQWSDIWRRRKELSYEPETEE